jgi:hypothetical protein
VPAIRQENEFEIDQADPATGRIDIYDKALRFFPDFFRGFFPQRCIDFVRTIEWVPFLGTLLYI